MKIIYLLIFLIVWKAPALDAGPSDLTNGVLAAVLLWIRLMNLEVLNIYVARNWPMSILEASEPRWRPTEVTDTDGVVRMDRRQRLVRWDRRPPNEIFLNGFVPIVTDENPGVDQTDLYTFAKNNVPSIFVSTTKTQLNKKKYVWTPRSSAHGIVYQYEIYAPGGLDVNESLQQESPWPTQMEVAFPGGIQNIYIRSARELLNGRIQRIWINPNFLDPNELEPIAASSRTPQVIWREDHPDGNHEDEQRSKRSTSSDDDLMYGGDGDVVEDPVDDDTDNPHPFPSGLFTIESTMNSKFFLDLAQNEMGGIIHSHDQNGGDNQMWEFTYDDNKTAYKIKSRKNSDLILTWNSNAAPSETIIRGYTDSGSNNQFWRIEQTIDGCYKLRNLENLNMFITAEDKSSSFGGKEVTVNTEISYSGSEADQKWRIRPVSFQVIPDGNYKISNRFQLDVVVDFTNQNDYLVHAHTYLLNDNQDWQFSYDSDKEAYKIRTDLNSDLLLTWNSNSSPREMLLRAYTDSGYNNQYWRIELTDDGSYRLRNLEDLSMMLMLDSETNSPHGGFNLIVNDDSAASNLYREWLITTVSYQVVSDGDYHIFNRNLSDFVVDFTNQGDGLVHAHNYFGNNNEKWSFVYDVNKKAYKISSNVNTNLLLCWNSNASPSEMVLRAYSDSGKDNQYWRIEISNDGSYKLRNLEDLGKMVAVNSNDSPYGGRELVVSNDVESGNTWYLKRIGEAVLPDGKYRIGTKENYKKVIDYNRNNELFVAFNVNLASSEWEIMYDTTRKAYSVHTVEYKNLGWAYQNTNFNVKVDNIDGPDHGDWRYFWTIEYNIQKGCYLIRSLREQSDALTHSDDNSVLTASSQYSDSQLYHFIPI